MGTSRITASGQRCRMMPEMKVPWPQSTSTRPLTSSMITPVFSGSRYGSFHTPIGSPPRSPAGVRRGRCRALLGGGSLRLSGNHGCFPRPVSSIATRECSRSGVDGRGGRAADARPGCGRRFRCCRTRRAGRRRPACRRLRPRRRLLRPTCRLRRPDAAASTPHAAAGGEDVLDATPLAMLRLRWSRARRRSPLGVVLVLLVGSGSRPGRACRTAGCRAPRVR